MRSRVLQFPLVRIVLAAAPIVALVLVIQQLAPALRLPGSVVALVAGLGAVALYVGYVRLVERRPVDELAGAGAAAELAGGFALGAALFGATIGILCALGVASIGPGDGWGALGRGLIGAIAAALLEEILVRAILFRIIEQALGTLIALALSAAVFGLLHASNPGASVTSTLAIALEPGILLAAAFAWTRRLWIVFGLHAAWNFTEGGVFGASVSGNDAHGLFSTQLHGARLLTGGEFGPEASIVAVVVCLIAALALLARVRRAGFVPPFWRRA
jgi:membrane protease YdiL (CAAX protease family)